MFSTGLGQDTRQKWIISEGDLQHWMRCPTPHRIRFQAEIPISHYMSSNIGIMLRANEGYMAHQINLIYKWRSKKYSCLLIRCGRHCHAFVNCWVNQQRQYIGAPMSSQVRQQLLFMLKQNVGQQTKIVNFRKKNKTIEILFQNHDLFDDFSPFQDLIFEHFEKTHVPSYATILVELVPEIDDDLLNYAVDMFA